MRSPGCTTRTRLGPGRRDVGGARNGHGSRRRGSSSGRRRRLGLHLVRTQALRDGEPSRRRRAARAALGVEADLPATNDRLRTCIEAPAGSFPSRSVRRRGTVTRSTAFASRGRRRRPAPGVPEALGRRRPTVIAPVDPYVSTARSSRSGGFARARPAVEAARRRQSARRGSCRRRAP